MADVDADIAAGFTSSHAECVLLDIDDSELAHTLGDAHLLLY